MEASVATFSQRLHEPWLTDSAAQERLRNHFTATVTILDSLPSRDAVVIDAVDPQLTLAAVLAVLATRRKAFIANPLWTPAQRAEAQQLIGGTQLWLRDPQEGGTAPRAEPYDTILRAEPHSTTPATESHGTSPPAAPATAANPVPAAANISPIAANIAPAVPAAPHADDGYLMIPTGGTGGRLKFACHNWQSLHAAIAGYARFWQAERLNFVCALPVCHIGGLMLALRPFATGGRLCLLPWQQLQAMASGSSEAGSPQPVASAPPAGLPDLLAHADKWHISLVPTQLQRLLSGSEATQWLRQMQAVLIGGGASAEPLLQAAAEAGIPLSPAYGMTETAATIALQRPEDFLHTYKPPSEARSQPSVNASSGTPQPLSRTAPQGEVLPHLSAVLEAGSNRIILSGSSLFYGYYPQAPQRQAQFATSDFGQLQTQASDGRQWLRVLGRLDRVVISGGKKIDPALVERAIAEQAAALGQTLDGVLAIGVADARWGERLVAFIQWQNARGGNAALQDLAATLRQRLGAHQCPKQWIVVTALPLDERGKPDRARIAQLASAADLPA